MRQFDFGCFKNSNIEEEFPFVMGQVVTEFFRCYS
jgi:hypothetical protein